MVDSNQIIDVIYHENGSLTNNENSYILLDNLGNVFQVRTTTGSQIIHLVLLVKIL